MRIKPAHTLLKPVLMWVMIATYLALGDVRVNHLIAMYIP